MRERVNTHYTNAISPGFPTGFYCMVRLVVCIQAQQERKEGGPNLWHNSNYLSIELNS